MIRLGVFGVSIYPPKGIMFQNRGIIIFKGRCSIGNDSYISIGKSGCLVLGDGFQATTSLKIACYDNIEFGKGCVMRLGMYFYRHRFLSYEIP